MIAIVLIVVLVVSIVFNVVYFLSGLKADGYVVLIQRPGGKRAIRIEPNTEPDNLRVGERYVLKIVAGQEEPQDELPFADNT